MSNDKRVFLITGCSSGVGLETAYTLANASPQNHVIFTARSATKGKATFEETLARKPAGSLSFLELDVTSDDSIANAVQVVEKEFGKLDVLINNAAITEPVRLAVTERPTYDRETIRKVFDANAFGPLLLTQAMEPLLKKAAAPVIVDVSTSIGSLSIKQDHSDYTASVLYDVYRASKSAMNMVSACSRWNFREWAKVFTISPGFVITNLSGPEDVEFRKQNGGITADVPARQILRIVNGELDQFQGKLMDHEGGEFPW